ncbi:unnamed protein product [Symbiodinium sp. CCMP2592]|nr:unnamed protein product [Symbiodinium sp. CCMP2592]
MWLLQLAAYTGLPLLGRSWRDESRSTRGLGCLWRWSPSPQPVAALGILPTCLRRHGGGVGDVRTPWPKALGRLGPWPGRYEGMVLESAWGGP